MWSVESEYEFIAVKEKMPSKETDPEIFQISSFLSLYYLVNEAENPPEIGQVSILAFIAFTGKVHEKGGGCHCVIKTFFMQSSRVSTEFGEGPVFGSRQFEPEEQNAIQATLQSLPSPPTQQLGTSDVGTESVSFIRRKTGVIQLNPKLIWQMSCFSRVVLCDSRVVSTAGVIGL